MHTYTNAHKHTQQTNKKTNKPFLRRIEIDFIKLFNLFDYLFNLTEDKSIQIVSFCK